MSASRSVAPSTIATESALCTFCPISQGRSNDAIMRGRAGVPSHGAAALLGQRGADVPGGVFQSAVGGLLGMMANH